MSRFQTGEKLSHSQKSFLLQILQWQEVCLANWGDGQEDDNGQSFAQGDCLYEEWQYALFVHSERHPVGRPEELLAAFVERAGLGRPGPAGLSSHLLIGPFFLVN